MRSKWGFLWAWGGAALLAASPAQAGVRIKDITRVEGDAGSPLTGFGLVVGLDGTGGKKTATQQLAVDMLKKFGFTASISEFKSESIAMVIVTATIPPFARRGGRMDVTVSVFDDARSLQGGTLLMTPLRGADGEVYAIAQGPVSIGGFGFSGRAAAAQKNHLTNGRVPDGASVVREVACEATFSGRVQLILNDPDYTTARAIARAISARFAASASAVDAGTVRITLPGDRVEDVVGFLDDIGMLEVAPDVPARIIINEKTGTIVAGQHVKIDTVAIAHGNIAITTAEEPQVVQPAPLSGGETQIVPRTGLRVEEQAGGLHVLDRSVTVGDLAQALNALGVTPRDLIAIFQALKEAGALHAELVSM